MRGDTQCSILQNCFLLHHVYAPSPRFGRIASHAILESLTTPLPRGERGFPPHRKTPEAEPSGV